jgi:hypothetical protein
MSKTTELKSEEKANRVQVDSLPQQEKELTGREAEKVKGGGGLAGGVLNNRQIGEEIPQTVRK